MLTIVPEDRVKGGTHPVLWQGGRPALPHPQPGQRIYRAARGVHSRSCYGTIAGVWPLGPDASLETRGLTKRFGGLMAVDSLPLAVRAGEVRGLIGPNGSGKTTTINLLSGLYRADRGEIYLRGERIERLRPHEITARGVVRTFQIPKLFGNMTVLENVMVPALAALDRGPGPARTELAARARQLLALVTLDRLRHALAKELSGGKGMLLQIARGLMVQPRHLFLLDEPFAGVHPTVKDTIMAAILRMNQEEGMTFLIVSHEMTTLRRLCPRVSVMHEGRLIAEGSFEEAANHPGVLEAYLGG